MLRDGLSRSGRRERRGRKDQSGKECAHHGRISPIPH
jgi:hypothetical protein